MNARRTIISLAAILGLAASAGCADDSTREPSQQDYDDAAAAMGSWMASDQAGETRFMGMSAQEASGDGQAAKADGLDLSVDLQLNVDCKDAQGVETACGSDTSSASADVAFDGSIAFPHLDAEATYDASWTMMGLDTTTATLNGSATATFDSAVTTWSGANKTIAFDYSATYDAVGVDTQTGAIVNGVATYQVYFDRQVDRPQGRDTDYTVSMMAEATFDADGVATLQFDGKRTYEVDLDTGAVVHVDAR